MICRAFSAPRYDSWNFPSSEGLARFSHKLSGTALRYDVPSFAWPPAEDKSGLVSLEIF